ncbi:hypothetical protein OG618_37155 (plasmid) [Kitasatospora sp. NBC_01246]|uniref:phage tail tube protein n=1 Tax=Kitasatospora sp. NBC_01246 TaxID=2903570 RepID=UPI002E3346CF|nr:hypothetical protein [Kitasatospora sp. NBC_01246]
MSLPPLVPVEKYSRRGTSQFLFVPTIAALTMIPTRVEITAGNNLTAGIAEVNGWTAENQAIDVPDMSDTFDGTIPGSDKAADSSLTFYEDSTTNVTEELLKKGTTGFIVIFRKGDIPTNKSMDIFPVRVGSVQPAYSADNEAAKFTVNFSITSRPVQGAPVPAAT